MIVNQWILQKNHSVTDNTSQFNSPVSNEGNQETHKYPQRRQTAPDQFQAGFHLRGGAVVYGPQLYSDKTKRY